MNQQQTKYTLARVDTIERQKLEEARTKHRIPAKVITKKEAQRLIVKGEVKPIKVRDGEFSSYDDVMDFFDFSKFHHGQKLADAFTPDEAAIKAQANRIRDEIVLGDNAQALALLREFAGE
ncbi:hypothetical protein [Brucella sp. 10RB9213]|uniref:hypothetical protein n=1 Tax=Brucella sp. 10RB9213 TaxID=1844039 RepID=UPI0012ADA068|nr:hypothetical protein [Brucella sp. 10RB9213]MRN66388.1 hypothetical protein [Brucella sp. 10RB9213]